MISVDLNELPMRIAKSSTKCFKDYLIMVHVSANVSCKKLLEVLPILTFRVVNCLSIDLIWLKSKRF